MIVLRRWCALAHPDSDYAFGFGLHCLRADN